MVAERRHDEMGEELVWSGVKSLDGRRPTSSTKVRSNLGDADEKIQLNEQRTADCSRENIAEVEGGLQKTFGGILVVMDKNFIPSAITGKLKVFYHKVKVDDYRPFGRLCNS